MEILVPISIQSESLLLEITINRERHTTFLGELSREISKVICLVMLNQELACEKAPEVGAGHSRQMHYTNLWL
jgi:hypothetical protein